jgi:hypothetical protein
MKAFTFLIGCLFGAASACAWIDYSDNVPKQEPAFGKEFAGFALKIYTEKVEFEQEQPVEVTIEIRNSNPRSTLLPQEADEGRRYALYVVLADKSGNSLFSRNLLDNVTDNFVAQGRIPPGASTVLAQVPFDSLTVAKVEEYEHGIPYFDPKKRGVSAGGLSPQLFTLKAVLLSAEAETRPDFVVASDLWRILLLPKSVDRMTADEKSSKMKRYLDKMAEGAYGGIGVSSQLAAFGDDAVEPLIEMAERTGEEGAVRESRIWAIVTLCNTGSKRAEDYIVKRLQDPVSFGDLAFLAWHSQGFHSKHVTDTLSRLCEDIATGKPLPWEKKHGPKSRTHGRGCLEFAFKHFAAIRRSITDDTAAGVVAMGDPKIASFGLAAWKPADPQAAVRVIKPLFLQQGVHGNLKKAALNVLADALVTRGFPAYDREKNVNEQWLQAALWLSRNSELTAPQLRACLRGLVFDVRKENSETQEILIAALRSQAGPSFPVPKGPIVLPDHWVATWRWALHDTETDPREAAAFLCNQMRTREAIPDVVRIALLLELKHFVGDPFPLKATTAKDVDLETDWPTCGQWLVENGYFGKNESQ